MQEVYCRLLGEGRRRRRFDGSSEAQLMTYLQRVAVSVVVDGVEVTGARWFTRDGLAAGASLEAEVKTKTQLAGT